MDPDGEALMRRMLLVALLLSGCKQDVTFPRDGSMLPSLPTPDYAHQARFAITDNLSDELSFVAADATSQLFANIPVGDVPVELEGPHHIAAADGYLYVNLSNYVPGTGSGPHGSHGTGTVPGSLLKLDAATGERVGEVLVDRSPGDVILSADGKTAYVTHYDLIKWMKQVAENLPPEAAYSTVAIVDTASMRRLSMAPICVTGHGEGLSPDGKTLYVVCSLADEMVAVDVSVPAKPKVTARVKIGPMPGAVGTPRYYPYALSVAPDGTVWISNNSSGDVRVYDPATGMMDPNRVVFVGGVAMFGSFSEDGATFYVPHQGDDKLTAIDTPTLATRDLVLPPRACLNAHAFVLAPGGATGVVVCEGDHVKRPGSAVTIVMEGFFVGGYVETAMFSDGAAWLPPVP
jgi:DNA-binding beta-propeller fold protein YncE